MRKQVAFTVSGDRPEYLKVTLESWCLAYRPDWSFNFYLEPGAHAEECKEMIRAFHDANLARGEIYPNDQRRGVLDNPHHALSDAFAHSARFAVLAEEDVLVSNDVLDYMNHVKELWLPEHRGLSGQLLGVCAFARGGPTEDVNGYEFREDFCPLVWGTWMQSWVEHIGPNWHTYARGPKEGVEEGWDWGMQRLRRALGMRFVFPVASRSQHIGEYGAHCTPDLFKATQAVSFREEFGFSDSFTWRGIV